jgi:hypothetical protein
VGVEGQAWQPAVVVRWCVRLAQGAWVEDRVLHDVWLAGDRSPRRLPVEDAYRWVPAERGRVKVGVVALVWVGGATR